MMDVTAIIVAIFASSGLWSLITSMIQRHDKKVSVEGKMLRGLAHDRICYLGETYLSQGNISKDEYENLHDYLYIPYKNLGGNGTAERIMSEVEKLPLRR